ANVYCILAGSFADSSDRVRRHDQVSSSSSFRRALAQPHDAKIQSEGGRHDDPLRFHPSHAEQVLPHHLWRQLAEREAQALPSSLTKDARIESTFPSSL